LSWQSIKILSPTSRISPPVQKIVNILGSHVQVTAVASQAYGSENKLGIVQAKICIIIVVKICIICQ